MGGSPRLNRWLLGAALVGAAAVAANEVRWGMAFREEKRSIDGVGNFGQVDSRLYRGAQPSPAGFLALKQLGIDTVVSFTLGEASIEEEAQRVRALGMEHISISWSADREPTPEQVASFLAIFREQPQRTVFVHCWQGVDRTGVMIALYRLAHDHWTTAAALDEMRAFHYRFVFQPHLQRVVEAYAKEMPVAGLPEAERRAW